MSEGGLLAWLNNVAAGQDTSSQGHSVSWAPHLVLVHLQVLHAQVPEMLQNWLSMNS